MILREHLNKLILVQKAIFVGIKFAERLSQLHDLILLSAKGHQVRDDIGLEL